jgi:hypothetical protein
MLGLKRAFVPLLPLMLLAADLSAQSFYSMRRERKLIANFGSGAATYFGELANPALLGPTKYSIVAGMEYYITKQIAARAEFSYFHLSADDANADDDRVERNLSFKSNNYEASVAGIYNLFPNGRRYYQRPSFNVYGFAGLGITYMNPKAEYQGDTYALQPLQTEGVDYSRIQPVIIYGGGVKFRFGPFLNILIEGGYRTMFTDYLDDVSIKRYPDPASLSSDLSRALSDRRRERDPNYPVSPGVGVRGNPDNNDGYFLMNAKVQYYLPYNFMQGNSTKKLLNKRRKQVYNYRRRPRR